MKKILADLGSVVVAYSGGVDSTILLKICHDVLEGKVLAVTAVSATYPSRELDAATEIARSMSVRHLMIETRELEDPGFVANSPERCYYCKLELFRDLRRIATEQGISNVVDGSNYEDMNDHRPGMRAAKEMGVRCPLQEAELTKDEIRLLSQEMGLLTWNKPSLACLASRIPYGMSITKHDLAIVEKGEDFLRSLGIGQLRLRHHGVTARIEVEPQDMPLLLDEPNRQRAVAYLKELGYLHITLDLAGYRTGSMNEGWVL